MSGIIKLNSYEINTSHKHNATDIVEDTTHRFVTDIEKNKWNNSSAPTDYDQVKADVEKLKSDVGTARTNLINNFNLLVDSI